MDANKVWQWRIMHVKKYSRHPQPFYHCNRVGLDFNIASSTKKKLDLQLVTNAVILEVCDFAKTVNKGKSRFLTNFLENNFDLGLENEQQRIDFTTQIHYKVRELIRKPPVDRNEVFTLFDTSKPECNSNNGLAKASTERKTERFPMEMDDTDDSEQEDEFMCSQEPSNGNIKTECLFDEMGGAPDEDREHEDELRVSGSLSTEELKEDFLTTQFPYCEEIGLNFDVVSKQRLDPDLLTKGVMLELEHVTRILTASYSPIVLGVLEHNFDLDLKSQQRRNRVWFKISQLLRRRNQLITTVRKMRLDFENEPYSFQTVPFKKALCCTGALQYHFKEVTQGRQPNFKSKQKKRALFTTDERVNKRCRKGQSEDMETNSLSHHTGSCTSQTEKWDYDESCPFGESDDDSERVTNQSPKNCSLTSDILRQSESSCLGTEAPLLILTDISSSLPAVNSSLNTSASQPNKKGLHGGEKQQQTPRNEPNDCDTEQEAASKTAEWNCYDSCPHAKSDYDPDTVINPVNTGYQDHFQSPKNCSLTSDFLRQSESSCLGIGAPFLILNDIFSSFLAVNSNVNTSASQPVKKGHCGDEEPTQTPRNEPNESEFEQEETSETADWDYFDSCPKSDYDPDTVINPANTGYQDHFQSPKNSSLNSDFAIESNSSCLVIHAPSMTSTDMKSISQTVNSDVNPPFASQRDQKVLCGGREKTQTPRNTANKCDMEQGEIGTQMMWKLRANRVKQILSEFGPFVWSNRVGLEFNVGFGPKQNIGFDSAFECALPEVAKFALAMNSSQQYFIMEILEYNFNFYFLSEHQRNDFMCNMMDAVRQLKNCQDGVKCSKEIFDLPFLLTIQNQEVETESGVKLEFSDIVYRTEECDVEEIFNLPSLLIAWDQELQTSVNPELSNVSRLGECNGDPISLAKIEEQPTIVDSYPFCKEIGLRLHVNQHHQNKRLDINKLTNGAMTEVINFAEKLSGTFEQICLGILRHNLDLDMQSEDSDLARNIFEQIPAVVQRKNLVICTKAYRKIRHRRQSNMKRAEQDIQKNQNVDAHSAINSLDFPDIENQQELSLFLWKLRANHIQQILSIPHGEHCPLYPYSRCKKLGIEFNVGASIKQNLDTKLLTNGIMVEICYFATSLLLAQKYFMSEILEYNFHVNFHNELYRNDFAQKIYQKIRAAVTKMKSSPTRRKMAFELPDMRFMNETDAGKAIHCPKCYQEREHKIYEEETGQGHMHHHRPHTMTNKVSTDADYQAQKPAKKSTSTFTAIEEMIMDRYPLCKKMGLNLCVNKDQPEDALDVRGLTFGMMFEVAHFTRVLCSTKNKIINTVLQHNFNIGTERHDIDIFKLFGRARAHEDGGVVWFSEVFAPESIVFKHYEPAMKQNRSSVVQISETKKTVKKRQLALQTKKERATLQSYSNSDTEQEEIGTKSNYTCPLGESDLDSDEIADPEKFGDHDHLQNPKSCSLSSYILRESKSNCLGIREPFVILTDIRSSLAALNSDHRTRNFLVWAV
ncbi:uncharacterized protein LOC121955829 [Plectropomus leopardus]|uniref:uncharacterized protein LOC121955829 n=1 Tax=Plectropomus leopardus TaxID=160734 RepID=UPI001C4B4618|nr:uncharacterized protein LOC121955829 [Plectropomus leopardus]